MTLLIITILMHESINCQHPQNTEKTSVIPDSIREPLVMNPQWWQDRNRRLHTPPGLRIKSAMTGGRVLSPGVMTNRELETSCQRKKTSPLL